MNSPLEDALALPGKFYLDDKMASATGSIGAYEKALAVSGDDVSHAAHQSMELRLPSQFPVNAHGNQGAISLQSWR